MGGVGLSKREARQELTAWGSQRAHCTASCRHHIAVLIKGLKFSLLCAYMTIFA
jgi:hypothetical protein